MLHALAAVAPALRAAARPGAASIGPLPSVGAVGAAARPVSVLARTRPALLTPRRTQPLSLAAALFRPAVVASVGVPPTRRLSAAASTGAPVATAAGAASAVIPAGAAAKPPASAAAGAGGGKPATTTTGGGGPPTRKILATLLHYTWPAGQPGLRARVVASLALLVGGKLINIQVPFIFKAIVDSLSVGGAAVASAAGDGGATVAAALTAADAALAPLTGAPLSLTVPFALLAGYGLARATATGFSELRNAIFASVAQRAIRLVSTDVFQCVDRVCTAAGAA
jgi:hypothetical protein